jgi:UDP-N-acetylglucosamine 1-carboxyvinyltransferase
MSYMLVHGGRPLRGTTTPVANKNSILKLIPASLLTDEDVIIHNVPHSSDVVVMLQILEKLGGSYEWFNDKTSLTINCSQVHNHEIDPELGDKIKASAMYL